MGRSGCDRDRKGFQHTIPFPRFYALRVGCAYLCAPLGFFFLCVFVCVCVCVCLVFLFLYSLTALTAHTNSFPSLLTVRVANAPFPFRFSDPCFDV